VLALGVEGSINQLVEVVEAVVHERVLQVVIESLPEALLLIAIMGDLSGGVASELEEAVTVLSHRHSSLKMIITGRNMEIYSAFLITRVALSSKEIAERFYSNLPA
jgi:hypothetical protein